MQDFTNICIEELGGGTYRLICPECGAVDPATVTNQELGLMALRNDFNTICIDCEPNAGLPIPYQVSHKGAKNA